MYDPASHPSPMHNMQILPACRQPRGRRGGRPVRPASVQAELRGRPRRRGWRVERGRHAAHAARGLGLRCARSQPGPRRSGAGRARRGAAVLGDHAAQRGRAVRQRQASRAPVASLAPFAPLARRRAWAHPAPSLPCCAAYRSFAGPCWRASAPMRTPSRLALSSSPRTFPQPATSPPLQPIRTRRRSSRRCAGWRAAPSCAACPAPARWRPSDARAAWGCRRRLCISGKTCSQALVPFSALQTDPTDACLYYAALNTCGA